MERQELRKRISQVVCTEATAATTPDFMATHQPFEKLNVVQTMVRGTGDSNISESEVLNHHVISSDNTHRFVIIMGDAGTGKSHLIRWMKDQYRNITDPNQEAVIFISRNKNTLQGALTQIIESDDIPVTIRDQEMKILQEARRNLSGEDLRSRVQAEFFVCIKSDQEASEHLSDTQKKDLAEFFMNPKVAEMILFKSGGPIERIIRRLETTEDEDRQDDVLAKFYATDFLLDINDDIIKDVRSNSGDYSPNVSNLIRELLEANNGKTLSQKISDYLNSKLELVVQKCAKLDASDLRRIFDKIRVVLKKEGKNLALFIEDFTSFTGLDKALMDVLINDDRADENSNMCRLVSVIGVTTYYYEHYIPDNVRQRTTSCIKISDDFNISNPERLYQLTARYMNAINLPQEKVRSWFDRGANQNDLPLMDTSGVPAWAKIIIEDGREVSMYPFTKKVLENVYEYMGNDKTPRQFLNMLFRHLYDQWLERSEDYPYTAAYWRSAGMQLPMLDHAIQRQLKDQHQEEMERLSSLLKIWGDGSLIITEEDKEQFIGSIPIKVFEELKLPVIEGVEEPKEKPKEPKGGETSTPSKKDESKPEPLVNSTPTDVQQFDRTREEITAWKEQGKSLKSHDIIRRLIVNFIRDYINWGEEGVPVEYVNEFWNVDNLFIENQTAQIKGDYLTIKAQDDLAEEAMTALVAWQQLGNKSWCFDGAQLHLELLCQWAELNKQRIIDFVSNPKVDELKEYDQYEMVIIQEILLLFIQGKLPNWDSEEIYKALYNPSIQIKSRQVMSNKLKTLSDTLNRTTDRLYKQHQSNYRLFNSPQGKQSRDTGNLFFDTRTVLEIIDRIIVDPKSVLQQVEKLSQVKINREDILHHAPMFLGRHAKSFLQAIEDEAKEVEKNLQTFYQLVGPYSTRVPLQEQIDKIIEVLNSVHGIVPYRQELDEIRIISGSAIEQLEKKLGDILKADFKDKMIAWSNGRSEEMNNYINKFQQIDEGLYRIGKTLEARIEGEEIGDVVKFERECSNSLERIKKSLGH